MERRAQSSSPPVLPQIYINIQVVCMCLNCRYGGAVGVCMRNSRHGSADVVLVKGEEAP